LNAGFNKDRTEKNFVHWFTYVKIMGRAKIREKTVELKFKRKRHLARTRAKLEDTRKRRRAGKELRRKDSLKMGEAGDLSISPCENEIMPEEEEEEKEKGEECHFRMPPSFRLFVLVLSGDVRLARNCTLFISIITHLLTELSLS
jgi:hypothetical protein